MSVQEGYAAILGKQMKLCVASKPEGPDHSVWSTPVVLGEHRGTLYSNGEDGFEVNEKGLKLFERKLVVIQKLNIIE